MSDHEKASFFERLVKGMQDSLAYSKGELSLVTTTLPAPPPQPAPDQIVSLRKHYRMSQAMFAAVVNVSVRTVQSWERGARRPSDAALRMLQVIGRKPEVVHMILASDAPKAGRRASHRKKRSA